MGKTRNLFKQIGDIKGTFHARMGMIKDRNGMALTEAEEIKKMWQECTEVYKKSLNDLDNHGGMVIHLGSEYCLLSVNPHWLNAWCRLLTCLCNLVG